MRHQHRSRVRIGGRTIVVESGLSEDATPELITRYAENDMTTQEKQAPLAGEAGERSARDDASLSRQAASNHLASVHELLAQPADDLQDIQTAKNLSNRQKGLEPQGVLLSFCLHTPPDSQALAQKRVSQSWVDAAQSADALADATAQAFPGLAVEHVIARGESVSMHLLRRPKGTRSALIDSANPPSDNAIIARLEALKCAR